MKITDESLRAQLFVLAQETTDNGKKPAWIANAATPEAIAEMAAASQSLLESRFGQVDHVSKPDKLPPAPGRSGPGQSR